MSSVESVARGIPHVAAAATGTADSVCAVVNRDGASDILLVCEHASNRFPPAFAALQPAEEVRTAHVAWDPGALGLARALSERLDAALVHATVSRLVYDLNRPPDAPGAMPDRSETFDIPANRNLSPAERRRRTEAVYLPFHAALHAEIARRLASGRPTVLVTVHSFTPVYFGVAREVELGVIHDADPAMAEAVAALAAEATGLDTRLNEPYSAADGVTHTLRLHATPYRLAHAMLEIRNDLIATPEAEAAIADRLAPVLKRSMGELQRGRHRGDGPSDKSART